MILPILLHEYNAGNLVLPSLLSVKKDYFSNTVLSIIHSQVLHIDHGWQTDF